MAGLIWAMLKEPRTQIVMICIAGLVPLTIGSLVWIASTHFIVQIILGVVLGVGLMTSHHFMEIQRSQARRHEAVKLAQFARLDERVLKRLLPDANFPCWVQQSNDLEKVSWINAELDEVWPFLKEAMSIHVKLKLQSALNHYKLNTMQRIHIKEISLGSYSPYITGIKVVEGGKDETILEAELDWRHNEEHHLLLQLQADNHDLTLKVMDFMLLGSLKIHLRPLKEELPVFGAIVFSLDEALIIDLRAKILEGDGGKVPGIEKQIQNVILTGLMDLLVWPSRLVIPVMPGDFCCLERKPAGQLKVKLLEGRELALKELSGKFDPVILFYTRLRQDCIRRSSTKWGMSDPVWNENFVLDVEDSKNQKLTVRLINAGTSNFSEYVGNVELPINQLKPNTEMDVWIDLLGNTSKLKCQRSFGKIHLKVEYKDLSAGQLLDEISEGSSMEVRSNMVIEELSAHGMTKTGTEVDLSLIARINLFDEHRDPVLKVMPTKEEDNSEHRLKTGTEEKQEYTRDGFLKEWKKDEENYDYSNQMDDKEWQTCISGLKPRSDKINVDDEESIFEFTDLELDRKMSSIKEHSHLIEKPMLLNRDYYGPEVFEVD